ncbi:MAG: SIS domain-containing protein [Nitrospirae bacterium]|nr:SIS domain-containing protein [Nitrospirota bacterium]
MLVGRNRGTNNRAAGARGKVRDSGYLRRYMREAAQVARRIDVSVMDRMVERLVGLREAGGRLFLCGVGGSAGNCSHAVNDFRKLAGIEAYSPVDNVSELTARTNDEGWRTVFSAWLGVSHAGPRDVLFVLSVGGGSVEPQVSLNLVDAIEEAKRRRMDVLGIVGRDGGHTSRRGDIVLIVPTVNAESVTPYTESFQSVVWHAMVCDPRLAIAGNRWESESKSASREAGGASVGAAP